MSSAPLPTGRADAMRAHLANAEIIKERMRTYRHETAPMGDVSSMKVIEPDAAMLERMKAAQAASDERAAKAAAAPPPPAPEPERGPGADQDPRYSETTRWALGVANTARKDLELLETNVRAYNSAKKALEDPAHLDMIRSVVGYEESVTMYVERLRSYVAGFGSAAREAAANISRSYSVDAAPMATDSSGFLSITDFTMKKTGPRWNLAITSQGAATVFAGGEDVSSLVDNRRMSGGVWIQRAPGQTTEVVV